MILPQLAALDELCQIARAADLYASPASSSSFVAFFGNGFWRMPTTTISFAATASCTSFRMSVR